MALSNPLLKTRRYPQHQSSLLLQPQIQIQPQKPGWLNFCLPFIPGGVGKVTGRCGRPAGPAPRQGDIADGVGFGCKPRRGPLMC